MSTFTMYFRDAIDLTGGTVEIADDGISRITNCKIGLEYLKTPWDATYAEVLVGKIYDHYMLREIGAETIDLFTTFIRRRVNLVMPQFNELYATKLLTFDPMVTIDITNTSTGVSTQAVTADSESVQNSNQDSGSRSVSSETPQTMLSGSSDYASAASDVTGKTKVDGAGSETNESNSETESTGEGTTKGYSGNTSDMLLRFRETIINIDAMVIESFADCFMSVWDNGDSYMNGKLVTT